MGIFDRFSTLLRSNINDLISRAENPEKMLNQLITDMRSQLAKAKQEVAGAIADEKKLESDALAMKKQAEEWERRAMLAVQEGRDDLAKQALTRYNENLQGAQQLQETWVKSKQETEALKLSLRQLNDKIEEAKRKKNILIARARRAEALPSCLLKGRVPTRKLRSAPAGVRACSAAPRSLRPATKWAPWCACRPRA